MRHSEIDGYPALLARSIASVARAGSPREAAEHVLKGALDISGARRGRLYLLNLANGSYQSYVASSPGRLVRAMRLADLVDESTETMLPLERAACTQQPVVVSASSLGEGTSPASTRIARAVIPIVRAATCIGLLDLDADDAAHFSDESVVEDLEPLSSLVLQIYERRFLLQLLSESQQSIDFTAHDEEFYEQVMTLVALTSQMEYSVLRELSEERELICLGSYGFGGAPNASLNLVPLAAFPAFARVVASHAPHVARDMRSAQYEVMRAT